MHSIRTRGLRVRNHGFEWMKIATAATALGMESVDVIGLRLSRVAVGGPKASDEAWRMYSEKAIAIAELQCRFLTGSLGATHAGVIKGTLKHYRSKVAANRRRLGKSQAA